MRRAAVPIPINIAEGYEKGSAKDSIRFYRIAKGSSGELRTQLRLCLRAGELPKEEGERLIDGCLLVSRCLGGFIRHLEERGKEEGGKGGIKD
jgi:four helix bundle protein